MRKMRFLPWLWLAPALGGCSNIGYYTHLAGGQWELMRARKPIAEIVADPARDENLRKRLRTVREARAWAVPNLHLPDNGSYTDFADVRRAYVVWNVFATPELSLEPKRHCFLLVGCLAYRGFFDQDMAARFAAGLQERGYDVYVGGVPAYSTLGWFDDPVINTMMHWSDEALIGTLFHELVHQILYIKDDTAFNESFAAFVQEEGLRQYLAAHGGSSEAELRRRQRDRQFTQLMLRTRERLAVLYASDATPEEKRAGKNAEFERMAVEFARLREGSWGGYNGYDRWLSETPMNNAKLLPFGLYDEWVPAFAALFAREGRDWPKFYAAVKDLGALDPAERKARLEALRLRSLPERVQ